MNRLAFFLVVACLLLSFPTMVFCSGSGEEAVVTSPAKTVTDLAGRVVTVPDKIERIIVLGTASAEVLRAIGVSDKIVGMSGAFLKKNLWDDFASTPVVAASAGRDVDYEAILALNPDVVVTTALRGDSLAGHVAALEPAGITVLGADCIEFDDMETEVMMLGRFFDREEEAAAFWDFLWGIERTVAERTAGIPASERVRVYAEQPSDFYTKGSGASWAPILDIVGVVNVFAEFSESDFEVDTERIMEINPEVFLKDVSSVPKMGLGVTDPAEVEAYFAGRANSPGWNMIEFVQKGRMHAISRDIGSGPTKYVGIAYFARLLYPELFSDINPDQLLSEYYRRFHGVDLGGIVAWPKTW